MSKRKYLEGSFVPCSPKHKHCSPAHAAFVSSYRWERHRQWLLFEAETALLPGDIKIWKENGNRLITLKDAMMSQTTSKEQDAWEHTELVEREPQMAGTSQVIRKKSGTSGKERSKAKQTQVHSGRKSQPSSGLKTTDRACVP